MSGTDKNELVNSFKSLAGVDDERATFFLESAKWDLHLALAAYYDQEEGELTPETRPRVADLGSLSRRAREEDSSSDEEGQAFFAGGSEHSGQQILGPSKKKKGEHMIENIFKSARDHGAEEVGMEEVQKMKRPGRSQQVFRGSGYRLGETADEPAEKVAGEAPLQQPVTVDLTFWENGFSVDDGELRDFMDPANKPFLEAVQRGEIPLELLRISKGREVHVNMIDKRGDEYVKPKPKLKAFTGEGHMLGRTDDRESSLINFIVSPTPPVQTTSRLAHVGSQPAPPGVDVDASKPVTQIQIRLANGSRLVSKFNHSHTVGDIRSHILASHPEYSDREFALMTTFPNKELTDEAQTIEDAKLINAVVVQRLK